jgi:hypothetical protein
MPLASDETAKWCFSRNSSVVRTSRAPIALSRRNNRHGTAITKGLIDESFERDRGHFLIEKMINEVKAVLLDFVVVDLAQRGVLEKSASIPFNRQKGVLQPEMNCIIIIF